MRADAYVRHRHGQSTSKGVRAERERETCFSVTIVSVPSGLCRDRTEPAAPSPTKRSEPSASNATQPKKSDSAAGNPRNSSQVWIEGICKEEATRKQWQEMYGWMADYDPRVGPANDEHAHSQLIFLGESENTKSCRRQFDAFLQHGQCLSLSLNDRFSQA